VLIVRGSPLQLLRIKHEKATACVDSPNLGISLSLALNPAKLSGAYKDYEFNLEYHSSRLSLDAAYQRSNSLAGDMRRNDEAKYLESGDVSMKMLNTSDSASDLS
jgi:hypothetical protein